MHNGVVAAVALLTAIVALPSARAQDRPAVGSADRVEPEAEARYDGEARSLAAGDTVHLDDVLSTGSDGRLGIVLADGSTLTLGPSAELVVDRFVYDPDAGVGELAIGELEGALIFVGGKIEDVTSPAVTIETEVATLGVRGTRLFAGPIDGSFSVFVFAGAVEVSTDAGTVLLAPGEGTRVARRDEPPAPVAIWPADKIGRAIDAVGFTRPAP
jgi:hypothetical protein